jgi:hypothetical protein
MNKREREKFSRGMRLAGQILGQASTAIEEGKDTEAAMLVSIFNLYILSEYDELNGVFMEAVNTDSLEDVKLTIPDSLPPDFTA